ncbi:MAG: type II secretion system protein GspC [Myxococcota bacterium]
MTALFKKHFWVVHLAFIAALAWTTASTVNAVAGSKLFVVPEPPDAEAVAAETGEGSLGRVAEEENAAQLLTARNVFDLDPPEDEPEEEVHECGDGTCDMNETEETCPEDCAEELETGEDDELEESDLPIELMGTLVHNDSETSMATLTVDGETKLAWVGSEFLEGQAKVMAIAPRHIVVKEGAELKLVKLWSAPKDEAGPDRGRRPSARKRVQPRPKSRRTSKRSSMQKGVQKTGPYEYEIDRGMLDEQLKDLSKLGRQARVVPNYRNGRYEGFKLVGVRPGSLYRSIGIRSGDVVKSINGRDIDSPNKALQLFEQLKNSSNVKVDIERRGQKKKLSYSIE